jgi:apolipoprotein N-acyltransferase
VAFPSMLSIAADMDDADSSLQRIRLGAALGLAVLGGVLLGLAYAQRPVWWAAWLGPALVLTAVLLSKPRARRWVALTAGIIGGGASLTYYAMISDSWAVALALVAGRALLWMWIIGMSARAAERWHSSLAVMVLPLLLVASETLIGALLPHGAAGSLAYSQMDALPLIQVASIGGTAAIVLLTGLGASAVGLCLATALGWRGASGTGPALLIATTAIAVGMAFGIWRLSSVTTAANGTEIALIATDRLSGDPADTARFWEIYGPELERHARAGSIVVLPEAMRTVPASAASVFADRLAEVAIDRGATIVAGVVMSDGALKYNRAVVSAPDGTVVWYDKQHLVPGHEDDISPGRQSMLISAAGERAGVAICKDMHFPALGREYARLGVTLMLVPANDFVVDGWMASRMTALRGVEGGYAVARTARHGLMSVSDRYGRILAERPSGAQIATLTARLPAADRHEPTVYVAFGWAFSWLSIVGAAVAVGSLRAHRASGQVMVC